MVICKVGGGEGFFLHVLVYRLNSFIIQNMGGGVIPNLSTYYLDKMNSFCQTKIKSDSAWWPIRCCFMLRTQNTPPPPPHIHTHTHTQIIIILILLSLVSFYCHYLFFYYSRSPRRCVCLPLVFTFGSHSCVCSSQK